MASEQRLPSTNPLSAETDRGAMAYDAKTDYERESLLKRIGEMEEEIARLDQELTQSNRLATLGILAGMIAHEFNNLLTPLMSYSNLAIHSPEDRELVAKAMTRTAEGTERLSHIASSILGFIRDDSQMQTSDVQLVVHEALTCLVREPEKHGIRVTQQIPSGIRVRMRPVALQQVLLNLFLNAVRSMQEQGGELRIEAGLESQPHYNEVVIAVSDTGPGISPEVLHRIFDPLVKKESAGCEEASQEDDEAASVESPGHCLLNQASNGLGLAVCRRLVEEAGGTIRVRNRPGGRGASFALHLPEGRVE